LRPCWGSKQPRRAATPRGWCPPPRALRAHPALRDQLGQGLRGRGRRGRRLRLHGLCGGVDHLAQVEHGEHACGRHGRRQHGCSQRSRHRGSHVSMGRERGPRVRGERLVSGAGRAHGGAGRQAAAADSSRAGS
jgi:hypothetical protein